MAGPVGLQSASTPLPNSVPDTAGTIESESAPRVENPVTLEPPIVPDKPIAFNVKALQANLGQGIADQAAEGIKGCAENCQCENCQRKKAGTDVEVMHPQPDGTSDKGSASEPRTTFNVKSLQERLNQGIAEEAAAGIKECAENCQCENCRGKSGVDVEKMNPPADGTRNDNETQRSDQERRTPTKTDSDSDENFSRSEGQARATDAGVHIQTHGSDDIRRSANLKPPVHNEGESHSNRVSAETSYVKQSADPKPVERNESARQTESHADHGLQAERDVFLSREAKTSGTRVSDDSQSRSGNRVEPDRPRAETTHSLPARESLERVPENGRSFVAPSDNRSLEGGSREFRSDIASAPIPKPIEVGAASSGDPGKVDSGNLASRSYSVEGQSIGNTKSGDANNTSDTSIRSRLGEAERAPTTVQSKDASQSQTLRETRSVEGKTPLSGREADGAFVREIAANATARPSVPREVGTTRIESQSGTAKADLKSGESQVAQAEVGSKSVESHVDPGTKNSDASSVRGEGGQKNTDASSARSEPRQTEVEGLKNRPEVSQSPNPSNRRLEPSQKSTEATAARADAAAVVAALANTTPASGPSSSGQPSERLPNASSSGLAYATAAGSAGGEASQGGLPNSFEQSVESGMRALGLSERSVAVATKDIQSLVGRQAGADGQRLNSEAVADLCSAIESSGVLTSRLGVLGLMHMLASGEALSDLGPQALSRLAERVGRALERHDAELNSRMNEFGWLGLLAGRQARSGSMAQSTVEQLSQGLIAELQETLEQELEDAMDSEAESNTDGGDGRDPRGERENAESEAEEDRPWLYRTRMQRATRYRV